MELDEAVSGEGTWVKFVEGPPKPKTKTWSIMSKYEEGLELGQISWFSKWRKYAFFPKDSTLYEEKCLRDIAQFLQDQTKKHKAKS